MEEITRARHSKKPISSSTYYYTVLTSSFYSLSTYVCVMRERPWQEQGTTIDEQTAKKPAVDNLPIVYTYVSTTSRYVFSNAAIQRLKFWKVFYTPWGNPIMVAK